MVGGWAGNWLFRLLAQAVAGVVAVAVVEGRRRHGQSTLLYIITWMLHQVFMYSNKVMLAAVYINDTQHPHSIPHPPSFC
jgi:hypothetical protein